MMIPLPTILIASWLNSPKEIGFYKGTKATVWYVDFKIVKFSYWVTYKKR